MENVGVYKASPPPEPFQRVSSKEISHGTQGEHADGDLEYQIDLDSRLSQKVETIGGKGVSSALIDNPNGACDQSPPPVDRIPEQVKPCRGGQFTVHLSFDGDGVLNIGESSIYVERLRAIQSSKSLPRGIGFPTLYQIHWRVDCKEQTRDGDYGEDQPKRKTILVENGRLRKTKVTAGILLEDYHHLPTFPSAGEEKESFIANRKTKDDTCEGTFAWPSAWINRT